MQVESPVLDFSLARQMYPPAVRHLIYEYRNRAKSLYKEKDRYWGISFSDSRQYSKDLGLFLADPEDIAFRDDPRSELNASTRESYFIARMYQKNPIKALIEQKQLERPVQMLDLMSYGAVHRELIVAGCAVGLTDRRNEDQSFTDCREWDRCIGVEFIEGDILNSFTWGGLNKYLKEYAPDGFDIILCRPVGGANFIPEDIGVYRYIFNHVYRVLNPNGGMFLTTFDAHMYERVEQASRQLNEIDGIEVACYSSGRWFQDGRFMLKRYPGSPKILPVNA